MLIFDVKHSVAENDYLEIHIVTVSRKENGC
jgi:hypothetical protein